MKQYFLQRLREPSTWRGIVMIVTATGVAISPEQEEAIISLGLALSGIIGVGTVDK